MKSNNESSRAALVTVGVLGLALPATSYADTGHGVPDGVSAQQHLHLFEQVVVSSSWLLVVGLAALALTVVVVRQRRARAKAR